MQQLVSDWRQEKHVSFALRGPPTEIARYSFVWQLTRRQCRQSSECVKLGRQFLRFTHFNVTRVHSTPAAPHHSARHKPLANSVVVRPTICSDGAGPKRGFLSHWIIGKMAKLLRFFRSAATCATWRHSTVATCATWRHRNAMYMSHVADVAPLLKHEFARVGSAHQRAQIRLRMSLSVDCMSDIAISCGLVRELAKTVARLSY